jgi:hypothetical protein
MRRMRLCARDAASPCLGALHRRTGALGALGALAHGRFRGR